MQYKDLSTREKNIYNAVVTLMIIDNHCNLMEVNNIISVLTAWVKK